MKKLLFLVAVAVAGAAALSGKDLQALLAHEDHVAGRMEQETR